MKKRFSQVLLECLADLGITIIYASLAGLLIVGIVASDDDQTSLMTLLLYAALLPSGVLLLIVFDALARIAAERRTARRTKILRKDVGLAPVWCPPSRS